MMQLEAVSRRTRVALRTVLLADLPAMLEDLIVSLVENRHDLTVVRGSAADGDLVTAAAAAMAQVVVVTRNHPADLGDVDVRLARAANISIVALAPDGASACLHTLRDESAQYEDVSAEEIFSALAGAP
jgi:hypothetical protein